MYSNSTFPSKSRTTPNAGIPSTKTVFHGFSKSDPPNLWVSSAYDARSKEMFDNTLLHTRSNSASALTSSAHKTVQYSSPSTGPSLTAREGSRAARTKIQAPPSSFHSSAGSTFISSTEPYRNATTVYSRQPTSSISSMSFGGPINSRPSTSRPRTADANPVLSRCNTSTNSGGMISESPASQRINVKSLMSKPTAIPCDRAQSVQSIRPSETEDSDSSDDPHKRRTHSLEILRKTNRRSKSVDLFVTDSRHHSSPLHKETKDESVQTQKGQITSPSTINFALVPSLARSPSTPGTARPSTASDWHEGDRSRRKALAAAKDVLDTYDSAAAISESIRSRTMTPASAIALAWTESQKRSERHERAASVPLTVSLPDPDPKPSQQPATAVQTSASGNHVFHTTSEDDPFLTWRMADKVFTPAPIPNDSVLNEGGVGATMKELSRKVAGVLGRPDKSKEKSKSGRSQSTNFLPHEEVSSSLAVAKVAQPLSGALKPQPTSSPCDDRNEYQPQRSSSANVNPVSYTSNHANGRTTPKANGKPQLKLPMTEAGNGSSTSHPNSSFHQVSGADSTTRDGSATSPRQNTQFSQSPSAFPTSLVERPPSRSATPNTLKKRSRPHLRQKSSNITPVTQANQETVGAKEENGSTTWKGLVRKLSGTNLNRRSTSTDRPPRDVNGQSESGHANDENVPPVPPLPKNFEIVDPETYLAERVRGFEGHMESDNDSVMRGSRSLSQRDISARSSRRSSPVRSMHPSSYADSNPNSTCAALPTSRRIPRSATDPASSISESGTTSAPRSPFVQSRRAKSRPETEGPQSSNSSTRPNGKDVNFRSYGASVLSQSSSDIHSSQNFTSRSDEDRTAVSISAPVSVSYDTATTTLASLVAQPIMPPDELYRRGEDEAASLRMRQQEPTQPGRHRKTSRPKVPLSEEVVRGDAKNEKHSPSSPPPAFSPVKTAALTAPPNRKASRDKLSAPPVALAFPHTLDSRRPSLTTTLNETNTEISVNARLRSNSTPSYSAPVSPNVPTFSTIDAINFEPLSARMANIADQLYQPYQRDSRPQAVARSRSSSVKRELVLTPDPLSGKFQFPAGSDSPSEGDAEAHPPHKKLRVKTSMGTISRVKSVLMRSGSTHTPSPSNSHNTFTPSSGGLSSANSRASRDHSYHYRTARSIVESQTPQTSLPSQTFSSPLSSPMPPVPFTSTAFKFKELPTTKLPSAKQLTAGEREDMWNALLVKSDQAGGTLTVVFHDQALDPSLSSDNVSLSSS